MSLSQSRKTNAELVKDIKSLNNKNKRLTKEISRLNDKIASNCFSTLISHFEFSPFPILILSQDTSIKFINKKFTATFGYTLKEIPDTKSLLDHFFPDLSTKKKFAKELKKNLARKNKNVDTLMHYDVASKKGRIKEVKFSIVPDNDEYDIIYLEDMTTLVRYKEQVKEKDKKIGEIFHNINDAIYLWDFSNNVIGRCLEVNDVATKMLGYSKSEFLKKTPYDLLPVKYHKNVESFIKGLKRKNRTFLEAEHLSKTGKTIPVEISSKIFKLNNRKTVLSIVRDVSERIMALEKVIAEQKKFKNFIDDSPLPIEIYNNKGFLVHLNKASENFWNIKKEKLVGVHNILKDKRFMPPELSIKLKEAFKKKINHFARIEVDSRINIGQKIILRINLYPLLDADRNLTNIVIVAEDITRSVNTENELRASEERFREIVENSHAGVFIINDQYKVIYLNEKLSEIAGYPSDELNGIDFRVLIDTEYKSIVSERYLKRQQGENVLRQYEIKIVKKDGSTSWVNLVSSVIFSKENRPMTIAQVIDINDQKNSMNAIKASEERFRMIMEQSPVPIIIFNLDGTILRVNNAWYKLWDVKEDVTILKEYNIFHDRQAKDIGFTDAFINAVHGNSAAIPETIITPQSSKLPGRERLLHTKIYPLKDEQNSVKSIVMIHEDITDRKKTELALIESEERYRGLYENASVGIFSATIDFEFIMANPAMTKILGYKNFESMRNNIAQNKFFCKAEDWDYIKKVLRATGEIRGYETKLFRKDKSELVALLNAKALKNKFRQINYFEGIIEDISERKEAEKAIILAKEEAEKSNQLKSEFLAQMSHEIRTPINTVLSFSGLIADELDDIMPEDLKPSFGIISHAGKRIIRTIDLILNMAEIQTGTYKPLMKEINLYDDILYNIYLEYLSQAKEKELSLRINNNTENSTIIGDEYTVGQIFDNLINNAIKYTHRGKIDIVVGRKKDKKLYIDIKDTGIGISQDYLPNLFEAFSQEDQGYTRRFEGNGLGLAVVKKYCELNEAEVFVKSKKGTGSTFRVEFEPVDIIKKIFSFKDN